jgi:hypothetical protein
MTSNLGVFNTYLIRFFEDLYETFPEERDIKSALELIKFAKQSNPKLVLDLFYIHVYLDLNQAISREDSDFIVNYARNKINREFNEISPALTIFDKYWDKMSDNNRKSIWKYLKLLCALCEKSKAI